MAIDPDYLRTARRLKVFDLVGGSDPDGELGLPSGDPADRSTRRFLDYYSRAGVRKVLETFGIHAELEAKGLGDYRIVIDGDSLGRHRIQLLLDGIVDDNHRMVDLIIRPLTAKAAIVSEGRNPAGSYKMLLIEWLCLQDPRADFTEARPRLPGQRFPGLGFGYAAHNFSLLMAQRLERDGVLNVPEHFHLAVAYERVGYQFVCRHHHQEVTNAMIGTRHVRFACAAWAAERGLLRCGSEPWSYTPAEMVVPRSEALGAALRSPGLGQRPLEHGAGHPVTIDLDELRQSFIDDPVEGIDPDDLLRK